MAAAKLEKKVGDLTTRADGLVARMEEAAGSYLEAVIPWVAQRFEADVAAAVVAAPEVTRALEGEGVARLRTGLEALVVTIPDLVRRRIGTPGAWPHRWERQSEAVAEGMYGAKAAGGRREVVVPPFLHQRLRVLLGTSGHLLARHGFESYVRRNWDRAYVRSDYFPPEYLARSLEGHDRFHGLLAEYADLCDEYAGLLEGLRLAARDRSAVAAGDIWNQA
jgi:hypothetical protein